MNSRIFCLLLCASLLAAGPARAGQARQDFEALRGQAAVWLEKQTANAYPGTQARARMGLVDWRLRLPACPQPVFFLPAGSRLWGNGSVGARCEGEVRWSLYLTYENRLRGPGLIATRPLPIRHLPAPDDLHPGQLDYTQSPDRYLRDFPPGARLSRPLAAGQPLLIDGLELPDVIQAGRKVRVVAGGSGFNVSQEGTALNNAAQGEPVKVRMPSGRVVHGVATRQGHVAVAP